MLDRTPQPKGTKGSLKWMQKAVNMHPHILLEVVSTEIGVPPDTIKWVSPLECDDYAEYRDQGFLDRLGIRLAHYPLKLFWPARGPQWDALGRAEDRIILVEAKAHLGELISRTKATADSLERIEASLVILKATLGVALETEWTDRFYQYANRLAHLYLLRQLNGIPAELVHIYFLNDHVMNGPTTEGQWRVGIETVHKALGITDHPLLRHLHHVFVDVTGLTEIASR